MSVFHSQVLDMCSVTIMHKQLIDNQNGGKLIYAVSTLVSGL